MKKTLIAICVLLVTNAFSAVVFELNESNFDTRVGSSASVHGTITRSADSEIPFIDFGKDGYIIFHDFAFPRDSFTLETYLCLNEYSSVLPYISTFCGNISWTSEYSLGVDFRIGGGHHYPLLPQEAYTSETDFVRPDFVTLSERSLLSKSISTFVLGADVPGGSWKEIYSSEGIPLNEWVHLTYTWDGSEMNMYLDGNEAVDTWRINGLQNPANVDSVFDLIVGSCCMDGVRHFNGKMSFLRIYDEVLNSSQIHDNYAALNGECRCKVKIIMPIIGQCITDSTEFELSLSSQFGCPIDSFSDSIQISIINDTSIVAELFTASTDMHTFSLKEIFSNISELDQGVIHVKISCKTKQGLRKRVIARVEKKNASLLPLYLNRQSASMSGGGMHAYTVKTGAIEGIYDLRGRLLNIDKLDGGRYSGLLILKTSDKRLRRTCISGR